MLILI